MGLYVLRLVAFMVDWVVLFAVFAAPQFAVMAITGWWFLGNGSSNVLSYTWVGLSVTLPSLAYFTLADGFTSGMTIGKRVMKVAVRSADDGALTVRRALLRNLIKLIPWELTHIMIFFPEPFSEEDPSSGKMFLMILSSAALGIWLIAPTTDRPRYRAVHDRVARTRVVRARSGSASRQPPYEAETQGGQRQPTGD